MLESIRAIPILPQSWALSISFAMDHANTGDVPLTASRFLAQSQGISRGAKRNSLQLSTADAASSVGIIEG